MRRGKTEEEERSESNAQGTTFQGDKVLGQIDKEMRECRPIITVLIGRLLSDR
jgi:hypothetical protein